MINTEKIVFFDAISSGDVIRFVERMKELKFGVRFVGKPFCTENIPASSMTFHAVEGGAKQIMRKKIEELGGHGALVLNIHTNLRDEQEVREIALTLQPYQLRKISKKHYRRLKKKILAKRNRSRK